MISNYHHHHHNGRLDGFDGKTSFPVVPAVHSGVQRGGRKDLGWIRCIQTHHAGLLHFHPFIHSFIHPFIHSFIRLCTHPFIHPFIHPTVHSYIHSFDYSLICSFIHSSIHSFIHLTIPSSIHPSFIYLCNFFFAHSFIH